MAVLGHAAFVGLKRGAAGVVTLLRTAGRLTTTAARAMAAVIHWFARRIAPLVARIVVLGRYVVERLDRIARATGRGLVAAARTFDREVLRPAARGAQRLAIAALIAVVAPFVIIGRAIERATRTARASIRSATNATRVAARRAANAIRAALSQTTRGVRRSVREATTGLGLPP